MKNWKTTLFGVGTALGFALKDTGSPILDLIGQILTVVCPALFGMVAKDHDKSGT